MKKLAILAFALMLMFSLAACGNDNNATTGGETPEATTQTSETPDTSVDNLINWMQGGEYYFKYTAEAEYEGERTTSKSTIAAKGDDLAVTSETTVSGQTVKSRIVAVGGVTYIIDDATKTIMKSPVDIAEVNKEVADFSKIEKVGSGTSTVNGKTLPYEEYKSDDYTVKFYMDGKSVYAIESEGEGATSVMVIEEALKTVPSGSFELPQGYTQY
jgi:uncharacterized lipoprotein YehR (DUF1307 family)